MVHVCGNHLAPHVKSVSVVHREIVSFLRRGAGICHLDTEKQKFKFFYADPKATDRGETYHFPRAERIISCSTVSHFTGSAGT